MNLHDLKKPLYEKMRDDFVKKGESIRGDPYVDLVGVPTIGYGFTLREHMGVVLTEMLGEKAPQALLGKLKSIAGQTFEKNQDNLLREKLDSVLRKWSDKHKDDNIPTKFHLDDVQSENVYKNIIDIYETRVDKKVTITPSVERFVFFDLVYNGALINDVVDAFENGTRADLWFQIRYNDNRGKSESRGIALRRYAESDTIGLYHDPNNISEDEKLDFARVYTDHINQIFRYEGTYPPNSTVKISLETEISRVKELVGQKYNITDVAQFRDVLLASEDHRNIDAFREIFDSSLNHRNILVGDGHSNKLDGDIGDDVLIGGAGSDTLIGDAGDDRFLFRTADLDLGKSINGDIIQDFEKGDIIDLSAVDANTRLSGDQDFEFIGKNAFTGRAGQLRAVVEDGDTLLKLDLDGDATADHVIRLSGVHNISIDDLRGATSVTHSYEAVLTGKISWAAAKVMAEQMGGHLATISSAEEDWEIFNLINDPKYWSPNGAHGPWLGGFQPAGSEEPGGGWSWVTGEAWIYENWAPGQPGNIDADDGEPEDVLHYHFPNRGKPMWNDWHDGSSAGPQLDVVAFVVEYES